MGFNAFVVQKDVILKQNCLINAQPCPRSCILCVRCDKFLELRRKALQLVLSGGVGLGKDFAGAYFGRVNDFVGTAVCVLYYAVGLGLTVAQAFKILFGGAVGVLKNPVELERGFGKRSAA